MRWERRAKWEEAGGNKSEDRGKERKKRNKQAEMKHKKRQCSHPTSHDTQEVKKNPTKDHLLSFCLLPLYRDLSPIPLYPHGVCAKQKILWSNTDKRANTFSGDWRKKKEKKKTKIEKKKSRRSSNKTLRASS